MRAISMGIYMMATDLKCRGTEFFLYVLGRVGLVAFAGLRVSLTLGLCLWASLTYKSSSNPAVPKIVSMSVLFLFCLFSFFFEQGGIFWGRENITTVH
ncbi:hypothetical protein SLEP1_g15868 [Rubroshorea leprosula]|uniref:Uncharacterized protein n=1 Tax=Rubroshorea leprosula TaxID=152421 RepID=A0AAV5J0J1_9ROSI|nr:hypothetical protein SLEP1_g15868 [Rubroshorea leprosula]